MSSDVGLAVGAEPHARQRRLGGRVRTLNGSLVAGLGLFAAVLLIGVFGSLLTGDPYHQDLRNAFAAPLTDGHLLGTDSLGRDVLSWIAHSVITTLKISIAIVALSAVVGVVVGVVAAYSGGVLDSLLMRVVDLQLGVPPLVLFIAAAAVIETTQLSLVLLISVVSWVIYARLVRSQILVEKQRASIAAARLAGVGHVRIIMRHLLPSVGSIVIVIASWQLGLMPLAEASLSFLNVGLKPPATSLGSLIGHGVSTLAEAWWVVVFPGVILVVMLLAANLLGDGLRDYLGVRTEVVGR